MSEQVRVYAAEWVLPVTSEPIPDGAVVVEGSRIAWVGPRPELPSRFLKAALRAFPRSLLLPGWVNAHTHLNLTAALGMLPGSAEQFADWIRAVIRLQSLWPESLVRQSMLAGMDLLLSTGTTTVAHVSTLPQLEPFLERPMRAVVFHEPIGFSRNRSEALLAEAEEWLDSAEAILHDAGATHLSLGIAPHAPYTVSPELARGLVDLAARRRLPLSTHVAETRAEAEFLRTGGGQLRELLEERNTWDPTWQPPGTSPVQYFADLGVFGRREAPSSIPARLGVHCNYLSDADIDLLAQSRTIPVWCPGSHQFFGHREHPARRLLDAGVPVALGTDSAASNAGLSMLREVRLAAALFPDVSRDVWVRAGTQTAAEALGLGGKVGSVEPGKAADLQVLEGVTEDEKNPLAALFEADLRVRMVLVDGAEVKVKRTRS